jgi:alpha-amylase/alpha-mannosidase (GH57 family)
MATLDIALIWHMHQPDYRDPLSGRALLPWAYLHAVKDYGEMLRTARAFPGVRMTFNLVPTLLEQLEDYAAGRLQDRWLDSARRPARELSEQERAFVVASFFSVYSERHILPHARYRELAALRGTGESLAWRRFDERDLRDLQVWFLLAWAGHFLRREPLLQDLLRQGRDFSEEDKQRLLARYDQVVAGLVEAYRQAESDGAVELSVTPYAHPILPLLCDSGEAARARGEVRLPATPFRFPEDARRQVRAGLAGAERFFRPGRRGMWPAEGGLSETAVRILAEEGALWAAGDEAVLAKSLAGGLGERDRLYRPYRFAGLPLLFRDRELSDRIGFVYSQWQPQEAADDLLERLRAVAAQAPDGLVTLILDGENCWERYEDNGYPFLAAFYRGVQEDSDLELVTVSEALATHPPEPLDHLAPGSWINGDFDIWIGHPEENRAWEWLGEARRVLAGLDEATLAAALPHLLRAEGSDWFWWFGEHHRTDQAATFDRLFRHHLLALYRAAGREEPGYLHYALKQPLRPGRVREPCSLIRPVIDGRETDYFEWLAAGSVELVAGDAMHDASFDLTGFYYGYDERFFYLRLDFRQHLDRLTGPDGALEFRLRAGQDWLVRLAVCSSRLDLWRCGEEQAAGSGKACCGAVAELALPLELLALASGESFTLSWRMLAKGREMARWPAGEALRLNYFGAELEAMQWPL